MVVEQTPAHPAPGLSRSVRGKPAADRRASRAVAVLVALAALAIPAAQGGYFPTAWGWSSLALVFTVGLWAAVARTSEVGFLDLVVLGALTLLVGWTGASVLWSSDRAQSVLELERSLVVFSGLAAFLLMARRRALATLASGLAVGMTLLAAYALATRLFPDRLGSYDPVAVYRLSGPIGYWNGLGIFCVVALLLQVGFFSTATRRAMRAVGAVSLVILLPTLYFTFSRGAWIALGFGLAASLVTSPQRLRLVTSLLLFLPIPVGAVALAGTSTALTHHGVALQRAAAQGHRLAVWIAFLCVAQGLVAVIVHRIDARLNTGPRVRTAYAATLLLVAITALASLFALYGTPVQIAERGYHAFAAHPITPTDLNRRLLDLSNDGRIDMWHVAWRMYVQHPWLGAGAGTYERYWDVAPRSTPVHDAHGLYIETLAELGPFGLALLVAALCVPLCAAAVARRQPFIAAALGGYVAFIVHAGGDWDWELSGVTLCAMFCGGLMIVSARREGLERPVRLRLRAATLVIAALFATVAFVGLMGNSALATAQAAADAGQLAKARTAALRAQAWQPWSDRPWVALAEVQLRQGDPAGARTSLQRALSIDPGYWRAWYDLALSVQGRAQRVAAARAWRLNRLAPDVTALARKTMSN